MSEHRITPQPKRGNSPYRTSDNEDRPVNNTNSDLVSEHDAERVQAITAAVYAGSKTRSPEDDVRFLLRMLREHMQQCDGECHEDDVRCIACESGDERMCDDCTAYAGSNQ